MDKNNYRARLKKVIPGGSHTYSRGSDQFPTSAPEILERGKGSYIWDPYGNKYLDFGMGLRSVTLGYANKEILKAANTAMKKGNSLTLPSTLELKSAEYFSSLIGSAEMVKFAKNGSNATSGAIKIARAYTNRDLVCVPMQHPFFSFDDWFISTTPIKKGIPNTEQQTFKFDFHNLRTLEELFEKYPNRIACVISEAVTSDTVICPKPEHSTFCNQDSEACKGNTHQLNAIKELCHKNGALFILDEIITGFRLDLRGAQHFYNVEPDISTFGKAMANGFALAAVTGKSEFMDVGSIDDTGTERTFLMSSTHGAEMVALGAFMAVMETYKNDKVTDSLWEIARKWKQVFDNQVKIAGLEEFIQIVGTPLNMNILCKDSTGSNSLGFKTLLQQELVLNRVLLPWISFSTSHGKKEIDIFEQALYKSLVVYSQALSNGLINYLKGDPIKPVFRKFN